MSSNGFTLTADPGTDVWRKPPHTNVYKVPKSVAEARPLSRFRSARLSFSFAWTEQYDQAGLLLSFRRRRHQSSSTQGAGASANTDEAPPEKWIKTGVEFYNGRPMVGTVACDAWADWSLAPLQLPDSEGSTGEPRGGGSGAAPWITVSIERAGDEHGTSLWVYQVLGNGDKAPLREICWVYGGGPAETAKWELEVAGFAARPAKGAKDGLKAEFKDLEVLWE